MLALSRSLTLLAVALTCAAPARADALVTKDGRVIEVKKAREEGNLYKLTFAAGEISVPKEHVVSVEMEGDMSEYVPKDDKEREFLTKGYVRHKGKWMSKAGYEVELAKAAEARRKRTAELEKRSHFGTGWEVESRHFRFKSNTSPEILQHYVDLIEAYYDLMDSRIGIKPSPSLARTKMQINVYRKQKEMIHAAADEDIDESTLGFFSSADQTLNFFHDYKDPARSELTALHECTHLLTYLIEPDYLAQIWLNEAVADYFGSCTIAKPKGKFVLTPGRLEEDSILTVQQAFTEKKHIPLAKLFTTDREAYDGFHYAHGWSFVYFIQNSPRYAKKFTTFFKDLYGLSLKEAKAEVLSTGSSDKSGMRKRYSPGDIRDAMLKRLGVKDLSALETEWIEFTKTVPIEGARARFLRGYSNALGGDSASARADLDAALAGGYGGPELYWARAYTRFATDGVAGAVEDFRKAVELAPLDAVYRADLAFGLTGWWGADSEGIGGDEAAQLEAQMQFGLAVELDPENDEYAELFAQYVAARGK